MSGSELRPRRLSERIAKTATGRFKLAEFAQHNQLGTGGDVLLYPRSRREYAGCVQMA